MARSCVSIIAPGKASNSSTVPDPILTIGDRRTLRVRVDVDETDVSKIRLGQRAYVTGDAYGKWRFWGKVVRVGQQLFPKNLRTDEPRKEWILRFWGHWSNLMPARNCLTACASTRLLCRRQQQAFQKGC